MFRPYAQPSRRAKVPFALYSLAPIKIDCACQRLAVASDLTSADARKGYALALHKKVVPSGTVGDALRTLLDLHVLTKPSGTRGHYAFDDPMFREWFSKTLSL